MADDQGEKTEEPSPHKIEEARKKGEVASSRDINSLLILAGCFTVLVLSSVFMFEVLYEYIEWIYGLDVKKAFGEELGRRILNKSVLTAAKCVAPVFLTSFVLGILSQVSQVGFIFASEVIQLKFDRLNPVNGFKKLFSAKAIVEVLKGILKFSIVLSITAYILKDKLTSFIGFLHTDIDQGILYGKDLTLELVLSIIAGLIVVATIDFSWEKYSHKKKLRMTKREVKEELKEREGSPEIKQRIRTIQREMAQKRMMQEVPEADVVITNPTHLAIVIKYDAQTMVAPEVIGKGADEVALKIREIAKEHDVTIVENVPLARALYKVCEIGQGIPRNLYKAVAEILAFVFKMRKKKKALS